MVNKKLALGLLGVVLIGSIGGIGYYQYSKSQEIQCFDPTAQNILSNVFTYTAVIANSIQGLYNIKAKTDDSNVYTIERTKKFLKCNLSQLSLVKNNESSNPLILKGLTYSIRLSDDGKQEIIDIENNYLTSEYFIESFFYWIRESPKNIAYEKIKGCSSYGDCTFYDIESQYPDAKIALKNFSKIQNIQSLMWWPSDDEPVGVVSTVEKISINNTDKYLYFSLCKPHDCADNQFIFLYNINKKQLISKYQGIDNSKPVNYLLTESSVTPYESYIMYYHDVQ